MGIGRLLITPELLLEMCKAFNQDADNPHFNLIVESHPLADDAIPIATHYDYDRRCVCIELESNSYSDGEIVDSPIIGTRRCEQ